MKLFDKEKGIILCIVNAIFVIWIMVSIVVAISNVTMIVIKEQQYTLEEYRAINGYSEYEDDEMLKNDFVLYQLELKERDIVYKRGFVIAIANVVIVLPTLCMFNREKKKLPVKG